MNTQVLKVVEQPYLKNRVKFDVGDTISVNTIVREGDKKRNQIFRGIVIAIKGSGTRKTFTIRKISYGVGVERIFPLYSPNIEDIELIKKGKVRRSKLYYMRERIGKKAMKIDEGEFVVEQDIVEEEVEAETEESPAIEADSEDTVLADDQQDK